VKWTRFTVKNAAEEELHFFVKWTRFTGKNAAWTKSGADSVTTETALAGEAPRVPPLLFGSVAGWLTGSSVGARVAYNLPLPVASRAGRGRSG
jgi:hypothetical protein